MLWGLEGETGPGGKVSERRWHMRVSRGKSSPRNAARGHLYVLVPRMFQRAGVTRGSQGSQSPWAGGKAGEKGSRRLQKL